MSLTAIANKYCPSIARPMLNRVQHSSVAKKVVSGTFWSIIGNGFGKMFAFIAAILVARILGRESFGEFGLIKSTATTFVAFSSCGMGLTATKYIAELLQTDKERTGRIVGLSYLFTFVSSFAVALLFYFLSPWLCETVLHNPALVKPLQIGALLLFLTTFAGTQVSVMTGFQDFRGLAWTNGLTGLLSLPVMAGGAYYGGMTGAVCGAVAGAGINLLVNSLFIYRNTRKYHIRYAFRQAYKELPVLWSSNVPLMITSVIVAFSYWFPQTVLASQISGTAELGLYHLCVTFQLLMLFIPQQLVPVCFPMLSGLNGQKDKRQFWLVVRKCIFVNLLIAVAAVSPFILFPQWILGLGGEEYTGGTLVLWTACLMALVMSSGGITAQILPSMGRNWLQLGLSVISTTATCAAAFYFVKPLGASGLFLAHTCGGITYILLAVFVLTAASSLTDAEN